MLRQTLFLALLLLVPFALQAAEPTHELDAADAALTLEPAMSTAESASGDSDALFAALSFDGTFAAAGGGDAQFGGCYTGCSSSFDSLCGPNQVAEITASGPTNGCALHDIRCVDRCIGPVVRCNQFGSGCFAF
ncbi:MAG: hypothetical protein AAGC60_27895 [Acidobacteriota bacterium]